MAAPHDAHPDRLERWLLVRGEERGPVLWGSLWGFLVLAGYYLLKPVRDEISSADREVGAQLWTGTFLMAVAVQPLYGWAVARFPRPRLLPGLLRLAWISLGALLLAVHLLPRPEAVGAVLEASGSVWDGRWTKVDGGFQRFVGARIWVERAFYCWLSTVNLFALSVMWSAVSERFPREAGQRLYGLVAMGSSLGALVGSVTVSGLAEDLGTLPLVVLAVLCFEGAAWCVRGVGLDRGRPAAGGGFLEGLHLVARTPRLWGVGTYVLLFTLGSTWLYWLKAEVVRDAFSDRDARTAFLGTVNVWTNAATLLLQVGVLGRLMRRTGGVGWTLAVMPLVSLLGFAGLGLVPGLGLLVGFEVARSATRYGMARPGREVLFAGLTPNETYKAKSFLDTAVYRGGDVVFGWLYQKLALSWGFAALCALAAPLSGVGAWIGLALGRQRPSSDTPGSSPGSPAVASGASSAAASSSPRSAK